MKAIKSGLLILILGGLLCACGKREVAEGTIPEDPEKYWQVSNSIVLPVDLNSRYFVYKQDSMLYLSSNTSDYTINVLYYNDLSQETKDILQYPDLKQASDSYLVRLCSGDPEASDFLALWRIDFATGETNYELVKYDIQGNISDSINLNSLGMRENIADIEDVFEKDGCYCFLMGKTMITMTTQGEVTRTKLENEDSELVLNWEDMGLNSTHIQRVLVEKEDFITILGFEDGAYVVWALETADHVDERTVIRVLVGNIYDSWLIDRVNEFNASNPEYKVEIEDLWDGITSYNQDGLQTKIQLMLTSSDPPDIIDLNYVDHWMEFAEKGAFENLSPYLTDSSLLDESDYLPNILSIGKVKDQQIFIPYSFGFTMLYGQQQYLGDSPGWTLQEFLEVCKNNEDISPFNMAQSNCLHYLLSLSLEEFIDFSEANCDFDNQLFYDLLQCAAKSEYTVGTSTSLNFYDSIIEERALMDMAVLVNIEFYLGYTSSVPGTSSGGDVQLTLKGFPSKDGQAGGFATLSSKPCFAICSGSANTDRAWQFLEYIQTCKDFFITSFPAKMSWLLESVNRETRSNNFAGIEFRDCTEADIEDLLSIIDCLKYVTNQDETILQIIDEEAQAYFAGQKSAEEVAEVIQDRVQLYLWE